MNLKELIDEIYNSNMDSEAKAEVFDIIAAYQRETRESWESED